MSRARQLLIQAERMMQEAQTVTAADWEVFNCNKALLLVAMGQADEAVDVLTAITPANLADAIAAYKAVAFAKLGKVQEATAILDSSARELGETPILHSARSYIRTGGSFSFICTGSTADEPIQRIKNGLFDLLQLDHYLQAKVFETGPDPFDEFIIGHVRAAAASVVGLVPMLKVTKVDSCEDDVSAVIRELLISRLNFLKWSVPDQSKTGFTSKENPGEADLLLKRDSAVLCVIEAVVCDRPVTHEWARGELTSHFQKLTAYSTCHLFFHLTYAYVDNPAAIVEFLKQTANRDVPSGLTYQDSKDIPFEDSRPTGFIARYTGQFGDVKVVFLVLNMGQSVQKAAAKAAEKSNPRKKKPTSGARND